jgi:3-isopropylmalate/(R)-2-methylmalate dehydratase small subunit
MTPFVSLTSTVVPLVVDDVDTDQIIPARFLKGTDKHGLGTHLFADWRSRPDFPLAQPEAEGARILLAGSNFGCGSSREHAPWALVDWGLRAVVARSFADIFRQNALKNGLLPVALDEEAHAAVVSARDANAEVALHIDLLSERVSLPAGRAFGFTIDPFAKHCLLNGLDELGYIFSFSEKVAAWEHDHPAL